MNCPLVPMPCVKPPWKSCPECYTAQVWALVIADYLYFAMKGGNSIQLGIHKKGGVVELKLTNKQVNSLFRLLLRYKRSEGGEKIELKYYDDGSKISWDAATPDKTVHCNIPD